MSDILARALRSTVHDALLNAACAGITEEEAIAVLLSCAAEIALDTRKEHVARTVSWLAERAGREVQVAARNRIKAVEPARVRFKCDTCGEIALLLSTVRSVPCSRVQCAGTFRHMAEGET